MKCQYLRAHHCSKNIFVSSHDILSNDHALHLQSSEMNTFTGICCNLRGINKNSNYCGLLFSSRSFRKAAYDLIRIHHIP